MLMDLGNKLPSNILFKYLGPINPDLIASTLVSYDIYFSPTFDENFGHSIFEAMQVGVIPLLSSNTPWNSVNSIYPLTFSLLDKYKFVETIEFLNSISLSELINLSNDIKDFSLNFYKSQSYNIYGDFLKKLLAK